MHRPSTFQVGRRRFLREGLGLFVVLVGCAGCVDYRWEDNYDRAMKRAAVEKKYLFIYYRYWLNPECTRMYNDVLARPEVAQHFRDTVNCQLERDWPPNREHMARYGVRNTPAFVIVAPDGTYSKREGYMPVQQFLTFVRTALRASAHRARPR